MTRRRPTGFAISREDAFDLTRLVDGYIRAGSVNGRSVSAGVVELRDYLSSVAIARHRPPLSADVRESGQALLMTYEEAGEDLACSTRTVSRLVAAGHLTSVGRGSGARLRRADVAAYAQRKAS